MRKYIPTGIVVSDHLTGKARRNARQKVYRIIYESRLSDAQKEEIKRKKLESSRRNPEAKARWAKNNPEKMAKCRKIWYDNNRPKMDAINKAWFIKNPESAKIVVDRGKLKAAIYRREHPEEAKLRGRESRLARIRKLHAEHDRRLKAVKDATVGDEAEIINFIVALKSDPNAKCSYCLIPLVGKLMHTEHKVPISRGGKHCIENLCLSCIKCNSTKGTKTPEEFAIYVKTLSEFARSRGSVVMIPTVHICEALL